MNTVPDQPSDPALADATLSIHDNLFSSAEACGAAGIDAKTLKNWVSRQPQVVLLSDDERRKAGERKRFLFSFNRIVQIALTAELVGLGVQPRRGAVLAAAFTDYSAGSIPHLELEREAGELFVGARTYLVAPSGADFAKIIPVTAEMTAVEFLHPDYGAPSLSTIVVGVGAVHGRVARSLGVTIQGRKLFRQG